MKDYIWNALGGSAFSISFPILLILVTRLQGEEVAGMFSIAFVTAQMFMIVGNYAVRGYQVSDVKNQYTFKEYEIQRFLSCALMLIMNLLYSVWHGYRGELLLISMILCICKMIDALADVYEGELHKAGFLYKAGMSLFWRTAASVIAFAIILLTTDELIIASLGMVAVAVIFLIALAIAPARNLEKGLGKTIKRAMEKASSESSEKNNEKLRIKNITQIFIQCFPLFLSLFLLGYINNAPKYALEGVMEYKYQTYFNAFYFSAQVIYLVSGFVFKPLLVKMSTYWNNEEQKKLLKLIKQVFSIITILTSAGMVAMYAVGVPILSFIFGVQLSEYRGEAVSMIVAGGLIAAVNFMYYVLTVMRKQRYLMCSYGVVFLLSLILPEMLVKTGGMWGACVAYIILLVVLVSLLLLGFWYMENKRGIKNL